jgi:hypothetical protein
MKIVVVFEHFLGFDRSSQITPQKKTQDANAPCEKNMKECPFFMKCGGSKRLAQDPLKGFGPLLFQRHGIHNQSPAAVPSAAAGNIGNRRRRVLQNKTH